MASARKRGQMYMGIFRDSKGSQRSAGTFPSEVEALKAAKHAEALANPPAPVILYPDTKRGKVTIAAYGPQWLATARLEPTSRESYGALMQHVIRGLGTLPVADLTTDHCRRFFRKLESGKLSSATVGHIRTVLRGICKAAVQDGLLTMVPDMDISPVHNRSMTIASRQQAKVIERSVPQHYALLVETLFSTGVRYGEAMGLGPEHIELNDEYAMIRVGRRVIVEVHGQPVIKNYGKSSNALRTVVIPRELGERLLANARNGFVFRAARGGYLSRSNFRRIWRIGTAAAGCPGLRVHDARHSHASWLANDPRVPLAAVRDRLGHASLAVTSRYVHSTTPPETLLAALEAAA